MARKVTEDDIKGWKELRDKGYTYERIGSETKWGPETVRKHIGGERKLKEKEKEELEAGLEQEARAFSELEKGKNPADLVIEGICSADVAKELTAKYTGLKNISRPEIEILDARMENVSYALGHALAAGKIKIRCPICHNWDHLVLLEISGVEMWVCGSCGQIPF